MNRIYRLVWSHVHQTWVIVSERARGQGKKAARRLAAAAALASAGSLAIAGPLGGQVTAGTGSISQSGSTTTINQSSQNLSLNWQSFNTNSGETVNFVQPSASAIAVNRIGGTSATQFFGNLNANGQVYLVNPNGILFGAGSQVNVGGLVASTLDINDASLGSASRNFSGAGAGSIVNQGTINAANGGYVAFLGKQVSNNGNITTPNGTTALAAGSAVTLSFSGNSLVSLQVNQSMLETLAQNGGLIHADGGAVLMSAGARDAVLASVVNNTGIIQAKSVQNVNGTIVLEAGANGTATNSGTLDASGKLAGETGGTVKILGGTVNISGGIDASGNAGGGTVLGGGNYQGLGPEQNAQTTTVSAGTTINADAIRTGNGGKVVVWSDGITHFDGSISAQGGQTGGNGGAVETSGKQVLKVGNSASVSTRAAHGAAGEWLLDPQDLTIGGFNPGDSDIDAAIITTALNNGNVTIKTGAAVSCVNVLPCPAGYVGNGDIILVNGALLGGNAWTANTTLTLSAYRNIELQGTANIDVNQGPGSIVLRADNTATGTGTAIFSQDSNVYAGTGGTFTIYYNPTNGNYSTPTDFLALRDSTNTFQIFNGYGTSASPHNFYSYMLVNMVGTVASKTYDGTRTASVSGLAATSLPNGITLNANNASVLFDTKDAGVNKTVTITNVTLSGTDAAKYALNGLDSKTATITKATATLSGTVSDKTYDGTNAATLGTPGVTGGVNGETPTLNSSITGSAIFGGSNAGTYSITLSGYGLDTAFTNNYNLVLPTNLTATINKANVALSGTRVYDGSTVAAGSSLTAYGVNGETFTVTGSGNASNLSSKNVQTGSLLSSVTGLTLGNSSNGGLSANYNALSTAGSSYTVTAKSLTITGITALDKVYDATTSATLNTAGASYSGLVSGDSVALSGSGTGSFATKNVGVNKTVTVSGYTLSGTDAGNYVVTQPTGVTGTITKADLAVSGISASDKTYDATTAASLSGTASVTGLLSDVVSIAGSGTGTFVDANASTGKSVTVTGYTLVGTDAGNYNVVQPTSVTATINKADLILNGTKTYDGTTSVAGSTLTAIGVAGQTFSVSGSGDVSNLSSKNVQANSALSSVTGLALGSSSNGGLSSNYNVLGPTGSAYTVTAKGITLSGITATDKTYDTTTFAALNTSNVSYSGIVSGDSLTLSGSGTGLFATKDVGINKTVTVSGYSLSGTDAGNYVVSQPTGLTASISKADLVVSGISASDKTYDATRSATLSGTASVTALSTDVVSVSGSGTGTFVDANAGTNKDVTVTGYTLSGTDAGNYNVVQPTSITATINKADLTLSGTKTYDGTTSTAGSTLSAIGVNGQTFIVTGNGDASNLASKDVQTGSTLSSVTGLSLGASSNGGLSGNYNVLGTTGSAYSVTARGLTLSGITVADKTYDTTTAATLNTANVSYSGAVLGDDVTLGGTGTGSFATKDAGVNKAVTVSGYSISGTDAGNYVLSQASGLTATINKADLLLNGLTVANKTYDGNTTAVLSGTVSIPAAIGADVVGLAGTGVANFADKNAGTNKSVVISGYSLTGSDAGNYKLTQPSGLTADIALANLNVAGITAANKPFDGNTAATVNVGAATLGGLVAGDRVVLASFGAFTDAAIGSGKTVNLSNNISGADSRNYRLTGQTTALADIILTAPPIPGQTIQNVVTQVQSSILPPQAAVQPQALDLSSSLVVRQPQQASANNDNERSTEGTAGRSLVNTSTGFGTPAPTLNIQNGGVQLPPVAISITQ